MEKFTMSKETKKEAELRSNKLNKIYLNISKLNKGKYILNITNKNKIIKKTNFKKD